MSKYGTTNIINSALPTWDSFEALFFVIAGLSVGIVFGILFPSIWRSFRRSFRKEANYAPPTEKWDENLKSKIKILSEEDSDKIEENTEGVFYIHVFEAFTAARYYFQMGDTRKSVSLYVEILTSERVSKQDTNRALFELSQVYTFIGLHSRAFDTAFELLNRKPQHNQVLTHLLTICSKNFLPDKLNLVLNIYKGVPDAPLRRSIAHAVCRISEIFIEKKDLAKAIDYSRLSVKWDRTSGRALIMLWETTSKQFWQKNIEDKKIKWLSFAADLEARTQISLNSKISSAAGAEYLSTLIEFLLNLKDSLENYAEVQKEFKSTFSWEKLPLQGQKKLMESIFYAVILLQKRYAVNSLSAEPKFVEILSIITNNQQDSYLEFLNYNKKYEPFMLLGSLTHQCSQCNSLFAQFSWNCKNCLLEESLFPVNSVT
ncbi:MAG: hypothetical protein V4591_02960 [Bdellovibrionota bacterium]